MKCTIEQPQVEFSSHGNGLALNCDLPVTDYIVGVFGPSGSGKSTLLSVIAGANAHRFELEQVTYGGQSWEKVEAEHRPFVLVSDETPLFPHLNVKQNITFVMKHAGKSASVLFTFSDVIDWCGIEHLLQRKTSELSSGETQRVKFARALMSGKKLILLDEAFSALDWPSRCRFMNLINTLRQRFDLQFIIVSHSLKELAICAEYLVWIVDGGVKQHGPSQSLITAIAASDEQPTISQLAVVFNSRLTEYKLTQWAMKTDLGLHIYSHIGHNEPEQHYLVLEGAKVVLNTDGVNTSSMVNQLPGVIEGMELKEHFVLVRLLTAGQTILAEISALSQQRMGLAIGQSVYVQFKVF